MDSSSRFKDLKKSDLQTDPFEQFQLWFKEASNQIELYPEHMILNTYNSQSGHPESRVVLLRGFKPPYLQFFTNYNSDKAIQLDSHPKASLLFYWKELGRQIRILGEVKKCSELDSDNYWNTRPRESQIHAWASDQSAPVTDHQSLKNKVTEISEKFKNKTIPRPPHWGGLELKGTQFEFWQEGEFRLHHRFRYTLGGGEWNINRLHP